MHKKPTPLLVVAAALVRADGKICMQQRPFGKAHGGLWEFPGGKIEDGESPEGALCREIEEELRAVLNHEALVPAGFAANEGIVILLYVCREWMGEVTCLEGEAIGWYAVTEIAQLPMPPLDYPLAECLDKLLSAGCI